MMFLFSQREAALIGKMIYRLVFLLLTVVGSTVYAQTSEVNVALNKPITAEVTCGSPPEFFYAHKEILKPAQNRIRSICDSANSSLAHPPHHAVDVDTSSEDNYTWWQSTSRNNLVNLGYISPDTILTIDLQEVSFNMYPFLLFILRWLFAVLTMFFWSYYFCGFYKVPCKKRWHSAFCIETNCCMIAILLK